MKKKTVYEIKLELCEMIIIIILAYHSYGNKKKHQIKLNETL